MAVSEKERQKYPTGCTEQTDKTANRADVARILLGSGPTSESGKIEAIHNVLGKVDKILIGGAMANTFLATAAAGISWPAFEWLLKGKPSLLGAASMCTLTTLAMAQEPRWPLKDANATDLASEALGRHRAWRRLSAADRA